MVLFLSLLQLLVVLLLLRVKLLLLLLVFLVGLRIAGIWRIGARVRLNIFGMGRPRKATVALGPRSFCIGG